LSGLLDPISRRASMPSADALQLYHHMTLQSMPNSPNSHHHSYEYGGSSRHILGLPSSRSNHHLSGAVEYSHSRQMGGLYAPGQGTHSSSHTPPSYLNSEVPLSAHPPNNHHYSSHSHNSHPTSQQNMYPSVLPSPRSTAQQQQYFSESHSHSGSGSTGSGYATPQ
jgi:hypothetical protein